ncbi:MAG TPA: error-prone DNA polymerase [Gammaproteobacteria bacterium]|nr:error-prone DNA polymerase [Gammaproteobacteria bacterium]
MRLKTGGHPRYAELHCVSNFSFLRGASHPEELVKKAHRLGYTALSITDECSFAGIVRAHVAAKKIGLQLIIGTEIQLIDGLRLVLLAPNAAAYMEISSLITVGRRRCEKGKYRLTRDDLGKNQANAFVLWLPGAQANDRDSIQWLVRTFEERVWIAIEQFYSGIDSRHRKRLLQLSKQFGIALVACGDVHMHERDQVPIADTLTAIRLNCTLQAAAGQFSPNDEHYIRPRSRLHRFYSPAELAESVRIAQRCHFSLDELRNEYPRELAPKGLSLKEYLRQLTMAGMYRHWPKGVPNKVWRLVEHELTLIAELGYEAFFLTVYDIVKFARSRKILCQGRGSAANSAVCFCLGITAVDPSRMEMLFERFLSKERNEPPDIDVDFEHDRREEVIQYVYKKYGRERAALAATVITYKTRSAVRDVGKALGMSLEQVDRLAKNVFWWDGKQHIPERLREVGFDPDSPIIVRLVNLVARLIGFPRYLSQHVGGFVISERPLCQLVPIENAAMAERTVIQWNKDDLHALGMLKVDCLCLGILSAIRRAFELIKDFNGETIDLNSVPSEDPATYAMIQSAATVGVFQIESRAQMAMLPRLRPACYYDLVIEIAIIRPGPIQGEMVHPYLKRRNGQEVVSYPSKEVRDVLERTLGVPLFQEQVIKIAMVAAGFTPGEAEQLRRSMAAWKRNGGLDEFHDKLIDGMHKRGYNSAFAECLFNQIKGFGEYGFPESHAASFALLAYVSAWLKCHHPAMFTAALLNSQPMGFYAPSQLVQDVRRAGIEVRAVDIQCSDWDCTIEPSQQDKSQPAIRLGLRLVKGLQRGAAERLIDSRLERKFSDVNELARRASLDRGALKALSSAGALASLSGNRHQARWATLGVEVGLPLLPSSTIAEGIPMLRSPREGENIVADYASLGLSLGRHPLALLRHKLDRKSCMTAVGITDCDHGLEVRTAGLVTSRQRPNTANGVVFITLEDETGVINLLVWSNLVERQRREALNSHLMGVVGKIERQDGIVHVIAKRLFDHSAWLGRLAVESRDFH